MELNSQSLICNATPTMHFYPPEDYTPAQLASQMMMRFEWLEDYLQRICDQIEAAEV
jgi:hypothetical protein